MNTINFVFRPLGQLLWTLNVPSFHCHNDFFFRSDVLFNIQFLFFYQFFSFVRKEDIVMKKGSYNLLFYFIHSSFIWSHVAFFTDRNQEFFFLNRTWFLSFPSASISRYFYNVKLVICIIRLVLGLFHSGIFPAGLFPADFSPLGNIQASLVPVRTLPR